MRRAICVAAFGALFLTGEARGDLTGNQLHDVCQSDVAEWQDGFCMGYVVGAIDMFDMIKILHPASVQGGFSIPAGVTNQQLRDVVARFLQDHPERRHLLAISNVEAALRTSFPC